jgi:hypothetical protein
LPPKQANTTANLPNNAKSSLSTLLENRNKPVARPTMGVLPSEMASKTKLKMDIFDGINEEDEDADTRFGVVQPKPKIEVK